MSYIYIYIGSKEAAAAFSYLGGSLGGLQLFGGGLLGGGGGLGFGLRHPDVVGGGAVVEINWKSV